MGSRLISAIELKIANDVMQEVITIITQPMVIADSQFSLVLISNHPLFFFSARVSCELVFLSVDGGASMQSEHLPSVL